MVKINKIYTRSGDKGTTGLVGGKRVKKNSLRVKCYGELDELNSFLGWARTEADRSNFKKVSEQLAVIQNEAFDLGAYLATPEDDKTMPLAISEKEITRLEAWIDSCIENLPELKSFVLPGGTTLNSVLHVARTICRRTERSVLDLMETEKVDETALKYLNRLSDYLFALARKTSALSNLPEYLWKPKS
jgi:cob(I)alamin adenosyltransferase